eukprot:CAMPEP_0201281180 /NCGR_PEP_ID=MMETSP1317-20130820/1838_1 /ASSEMBLY_ACC=CAM_ASM_000770 /TAXON_ID=187299 /ORGANISM="Undescribed Undescribed, Strain Undescribed" /LENGTH=41 /DNA_ID= /DNA_START= /DNA_END= /DNA_ORIENTATION=
MDKDEGGSLDRNEIILGLKNVLGMDIDLEESEILMNYLDED